MDPIRRLILLGIVASVILTEPAQARALFADSSRPSERQPVTATEQWIKQLAVVLRQTIKPAIQRSQKFERPVNARPPVFTTDAIDLASGLHPLQFDLPPPVV